MENFTFVLFANARLARGNLIKAAPETMMSKISHTPGAAIAWGIGSDRREIFAGAPIHLAGNATSDRSPGDPSVSNYFLELGKGPQPQRCQKSIS